MAAGKNLELFFYRIANIWLNLRKSVTYLLIFEHIKYLTLILFHLFDILKIFKSTALRMFISKTIFKILS